MFPGALAGAAPRSLVAAIGEVLTEVVVGGGELRPVPVGRSNAYTVCKGRRKAILRLIESDMNSSSHCSQSSENSIGTHLMSYSDPGTVTGPCYMA